MPITRRDLLAALALSPVLSSSPAAASPAQPADAGDELVWLDVTTMRARLAARTLSAANLAEAHLQRIERLNPALTAFITVAAARARDDAIRADRLLRSGRALPALAGVPVAHKDLFETAAIRTTAGSRLYETFVPTRDAELVARLAAAGSVLLGKCNTHELGGGVTTINPFFGTTRNPWDRTRIAGGSSGGSAVAVTTGMAAAATGSDTGGSVRIPAAFCGCVGFKPTFGRLSTAGLLGTVPTFDHAGLFTRSVEDLILVYSEIAGGEARRSIASSTRLRVGVARNFFFEDLEPEVNRAVESAIDVFRTDGHDVRDIAFPIDGETMARVFDPIVVAEINERLRDRFQTRPEAFSPSFAAFFKTPIPSTAELVAARRALDGFQGAVRRLFESLDVVVTPTVPVTAPPIEGPIDGARILRNTWPFNAARTPALSIPCGVSAQGLPIGLQLVAAPSGESTLLHAATMYQRLTSWHHRRPAVVDAGRVAARVLLSGEHPGQRSCEERANH